MSIRLTREAFHDWAEGQTGRYERIAGEPVAMSPERIQHVRVKSRVWAALDRAVREAGLACEALADGVTVEVDEDTDYQPDAVVNCGPRLPADATAASRPVIVVEVLSPSTEAVDSGEKLADGVTVEVDEDTDYPPDAVVNCGPRLPADATAANRPVIVVEVLSPSTEAVDSGEKLADYFRVPSIRHFLIVRLRRQEIIHHWRAGDGIVSRWVTEGPIRLDPPGIVLDVAAVYGGTDR